MSNIENPRRVLSEMATDIDNLIREYCQEDQLDVTQIVGVLEIVKLSIIKAVVEEVDYYDD